MTIASRSPSSAAGPFTAAMPSDRADESDDALGHYNEFSRAGNLLLHRLLINLRKVK